MHLVSEHLIGFQSPNTRRGRAPRTEFFNRIGQKQTLARDDSPNELEKSDYGNDADERKISGVRLVII